MLLFCPDCQAAFTGVSRCPRCGGMMLMPEEAAPSVAAGVYAPPPALLDPTPPGRALVGTVAALGLYLGLRKLAIGWACAATAAPDGWWLTTAGLSVVFALQLAAAVFGAALAAAGRAQGITLGAAVGGMCGGLFLTAEVVAGVPADQLVLLIQPAVLGAVGAVAGAAGSWFWPPVPRIEMPPPAVKRSSSIELKADPPNDAARPTAWLRVGVGAAVIIAGVGLVDQVRTGAEKASQGLLKVETRGQGKFLSWEMAVFAVLAGGAAAGAGTGAGLWHGAFAGVLGGFGAAAQIAARGEFSQPAEYLLHTFHIAPSGPQDPAALGVVVFGVFVGAMVGGWFGGQLFLPLAPPHMRNHTIRAMD